MRDVREEKEAGDVVGAADAGTWTTEMDGTEVVKSRESEGGRWSG